MPKLRPKEETPPFNIDEFDIARLARTKGGRMQLNILESAIKNIGQIGIENTTYESIAKESGVGKSHVAYYFADKDHIFEAAIKLVNHTGQTITAKNVASAGSWQEKIIAVVDSSIEWMRKNPEHIPVLLQYFQRCSFRKDSQKKQAKIRNIGKDRINEILKMAREKGDISVEDPAFAAEKIQTMITGYILEYNTTRRFTIKDMRTAIFSTIADILRHDVLGA